MSKMTSKKSGRREFISTSAAAFAGMTILPGHVISGFGHIAPSDKLNIACVGIGGMGRSNLANIKNDNIVALCDVDWREASTRVFKLYPDAKQYKDYRVMLDKQKDIEAVISCHRRSYTCRYQYGSNETEKACFHTETSYTYCL